jgi:hypothetical protein
MDAKAPTMSYQFSGYKMAFFLEHDSKEVIQDYYHLFWNWRATSGKLYWIHDRRAYFWTDEESMIRAYTFICLGKIDDWSVERKRMTFKGRSGAGTKLAAKMALDSFNKIIKIKGIFRLGKTYNEYSLGHIGSVTPRVEET